jgi:hypothetical protein
MIFSQVTRDAILFCSHFHSAGIYSFSPAQHKAGWRPVYVAIRPQSGAESLADKRYC